MLTSSNVNEINNQGAKLNNEKSEMGSINFDPERLLKLILTKWPIILLSLLLSYFLSSLFLRYVSPRYLALTSILIKDTRNSSGMSETAVFDDLGILSSGRNLDNELLILKTSFLMEEVVRNLNLQFSYENQGRIMTKDLYKNSPIQILSWQPNDSLSRRTIEFLLNIKPEGKLEILFEGKSFRGQLGESLTLPFGHLTLGTSKNSSKFFLDDLKSLKIELKSIEIAASELSKRLTVNLDAKTKGTVLQLRFEDENQKRAVEILEEVIKVYNEGEVIDKNRIFENTVKFIDQRIVDLGTELENVEGDVAQFKSKSGAISLLDEGNLLLTQSSVLSKEIAEIDAQIEILGSIRKQLLQKGYEFNFVPSGDNITSISFGSLLNSFNQLLLEREKLTEKYGPNLPEVVLVEKQLGNLRNNIIENINSSEKEFLLKRKSLLLQDEGFQNRLRGLPQTEKQLIEIQRQQQIKQQLFLYLLQKREEAALSLSVTVANNRVIEPPRLVGQVFPKIKQIRAIALSLGLLVPIFLIIIFQVLSNKVMVEDQISNITSVPIIGTIPFTNSAGVKPVVGEDKRSAGAEMFRLVRANLQFVGGGKHNKVIAITSSVSGEGKSFITTNLGLTLALAGKKVVLIEADMRKPKLAAYLNHEKGTSKGLTDFLINKEITVDQITLLSPFNENLSYIPCGPLPPNPSELLLGDRMDILMMSLKEKFDFILLDTPPIGLVSDALLLNKYLDTTIYVVRQGITQKRQLKIVDDLSTNVKMPRIYIIFNGVKFGKGGYGYGTGYGYGYGYNYGYGYGYYSDEKSSKKSIWKRVFG
jgi:capsular exopolysaccharide synthesis family protein